jgi:hypothetical protein
MICIVNGFSIIKIKTAEIEAKLHLILMSLQSGREDLIPTA